MQLPPHFFSLSSPPVLPFAPSVFTSLPLFPPSRSFLLLPFSLSLLHLPYLQLLLLPPLFLTLTLSAEWSGGVEASGCHVKRSLFFPWLWQGGGEQGPIVWARSVVAPQSCVNNEPQHFNLAQSHRWRERLARVHYGCHDAAPSLEGCSRHGGVKLSRFVSVSLF